MTPLLFSDDDEIPQNPEPKRRPGRPRKNIEEPIKPQKIRKTKLPSGRPPGRPRIAPKPPPIKNANASAEHLNGHKIARLTDQQRYFCECHVLENLSLTDAAIKAGYSKRSAGETACKLVSNNPFVKPFIQQLRETIRLAQMDKRQRWLAEIEKIAFSNVGDMVNFDGTVKPIHEMSHDSQAAIKQIVVEETVIFGVPCGTTKKLTLHDKINSLKLLGQANCWYEEGHRHEHKGLEQILEESRHLLTADQARLAAEAVVVINDDESGVLD